MSMRIMAHLLGLKFPGVEAPPLNEEGWASEAFELQDPESSQFGTSAYQAAPESGLQSSTVGPALYQRLPESFYREGGPTFSGYDFQSFTNPDGRF